MRDALRWLAVWSGVALVEKGPPEAARSFSQQPVDAGSTRAHECGSGALGQRRRVGRHLSSGLQTGGSVQSHSGELFRKIYVRGLGQKSPALISVRLSHLCNAHSSSVLRTDCPQRKGSPPPLDVGPVEVWRSAPDLGACPDPFISAHNPSKTMALRFCRALNRIYVCVGATGAACGMLGIAFNKKVDPNYLFGHARPQSVRSVPAPQAQEHNI